MSSSTGTKLPRCLSEGAITVLCRGSGKTSGRRRDLSWSCRIQRQKEYAGESIPGGEMRETKSREEKLSFEEKWRKRSPTMAAPHISFRCEENLLWHSVAQGAWRPEWVGGGNEWDKVENPSRDHVTSSCSSVEYFSEIFMAISQWWDSSPRKVSRGTKASTSQCLEKWP